MRPVADRAVFFGKTIAVLGLLWVLQACTTSVVVEGTVPTPLVNKIPAKIGVYYSQEFRDYRYFEEIRDSGSWSIDLGAQNLSFFRNLSSSLFESVVEVAEPPLTKAEMHKLDGLVVPEIAKFGFLTPSISGLKFYSASIEYRIRLYDKLGQKVGDWNIVGYGKSEGGMFSADEAINEATVLAIRDGGARIAIELIDQPAVQAWLQSLDAGVLDDGAFSSEHLSSEHLSSEEGQPKTMQSKENVPDKEDAAVSAD